MSAQRLTQKQQLFVEAIVGEARGNAAQSARLAGYKGDARQLRTVAAQNLAKLHIQEAIQTRRAEVLKACNRLTPEMIHEIWHEIATAGKSPPKDRLRATELASKTLGLFESRKKDEDDTTVVKIYLPSNRRD